jgi:large subunit ribosomal protein L21
MRYAIIESGGKQYKAVEGQTIAVDRLPAKAGAELDLRALLMADGDDFMVGTPTVGGIEVKATVLNHIRGEKAVRFKYSPKKRIRVRGGHRQQYTQLTINFIGRPGETRKVEEPAPVAVEEPQVKAEKPVKAAPKKATAAKKAAPAKTAKKTTTKKSSK